MSALPEDIGISGHDVAVSERSNKKLDLDLSVVIVNYNVRPFLEQALQSVERAADGLKVEVIVVDNNSVDGSVDMVREMFPDVKLIVNRDNVGFGRANNEAIKASRGKYLMILNPDTIVQEDTFHKMIWFMEDHPEAGAVGCQILDPDGSFALESRRTFPTPAVAFCRVSGLSKLFPRSRFFGKYNLTYKPIDEMTEVDALSGSCMLVRHKALFSKPDGGEELPMLPPGRAGGDGGGDGALDAVPDYAGGAGLFDEDFFMYGEDLDWCYRIQQAGWKIFYTPETKIIHYKGESTKKGELRYIMLFYGAMIQFAQKHFGRKYPPVVAGILRAGIFSLAGLSFAGRQLKHLLVPMVEFVLVFLAMAAAGLIASGIIGRPFAAFFYYAVAPCYALVTVLWVAAVRGYSPTTPRIRSAFMGVTAAFFTVTTASFFAQSIAYSRLAVLVGFILALGMLLIWRTLINRPKKRLRRAVLVGELDEGARLASMLDEHHRPPFSLVGFLGADEVGDGFSQDRVPTPIPRLGTQRQLRDVVRLREIDDVVVAAADVSNQTAFMLMQEVKGLPVQFRILAQTGGHVIGKSYIENLADPVLLEADSVVRHKSRRLTRRLIDIPAALAALLIYPVVALAVKSPMRRTWPGLRKLKVRLARTSSLLIGKLSLVGYDPHLSFIPPDEWGLKPGLFFLVDRDLARNWSEAKLNRAYWTYAQEQSLSVDLDRVVLSVRNTLKTGDTR